MTATNTLAKKSVEKVNPSGLIITKINCARCGSDSHSLSIIECGEFLQSTCNCCSFTLMFQIVLADGEFTRGEA